MFKSENPFYLDQYELIPAAELVDQIPLTSPWFKFLMNSCCQPDFEWKSATFPSLLIEQLNQLGKIVFRHLSIHLILFPFATSSLVHWLNCFHNLLMLFTTHPFTFLWITGILQPMFFLLIVLISFFQCSLHPRCISKAIQKTCF